MALVTGFYAPLTGALTLVIYQARLSCQLTPRRIHGLCPEDLAAPQHDM